MLPVEFYFLNATTTLLWLCQTVPHEVLLFLLVLGALCVLVSICIVVFRIVASCSIVLRFTLMILNSLLRKYLLQYFTNHSVPFLALSNLLQARNELPASFHQARSLTLPQLLALYSGPWPSSEILPTDSSMPESVPSSELTPETNTQPQQLASASSTSRTPLRRSSRIVRARARINV